MKFARNFFTKKEQKKIVDTIVLAEKSTTAEIRVHLENFCFINPVKRAEKVFIQQKMHQTKERNGVLFYIAVISRKLAIIGDKGIYEKVEQKVWDEMVNDLITSLREDKHKAETLCQCILKIGELLARYFPANADNPDELSNEISY
jgi:uncharacterized membrane protein